MGAESSIEIDRDQADMQDTEGQSGDEILNEEMNQGNADTQEKDTAYFAQALASRKRKRRQDESDETCVGLICSLNPNTAAIECVLTFLLLYRHLLYRYLLYCHLLYLHLLYCHRIILTPTRPSLNLRHGRRSRIYGHVVVGMTGMIESRRNDEDYT